VEVPAELTGPVRETVLLLYGTTAEALTRSLERGPLEEAVQSRARLGELDGLLVALGWPGPGPAGPVPLSAPRDLLHDALYGALIDSGERLAAASNRCWRGELPLERLQEAADEVLALDALLRALDESPAS
jgi:hypothetical protein